MSFKKSLLVVCFVTSCVVNSAAVPNNYIEKLHTQSHIVEALPLIIAKRQERVQRNETKSLVPSATTWGIRTSSVGLSSTIEQHHATTSPLTNSVSLVATTLAKSSFYSSDSLLSESIGPSRTADNVLSSRPTAIIGSQLSHTSTPIVSITIPSIQESSAGNALSSSNPKPSASDTMLLSEGSPTPTPIQVDAPQAAGQSSQLMVSSSTLESMRSVPTLAAAVSQPENQSGSSSVKSAVSIAIPVPKASSYRTRSSNDGTSTSQFIPVPDTKTPLSITATSSTLQTGISQEVPSSLPRVVTYVMSAGSLVVSQPPVSSSVAAVSSSSAQMQSPIASTKQESNAYVSATEAWVPSSSYVNSFTGLMLPPAGVGNATIAPPVVPSTPTPILLSSSAYVSTSESINNLASTTPLFPVSTFPSVTRSGVFFPDAPGTGLHNRPSNAATSPPMTPTATHSLVTPTVTGVSEVLKLSIHTILTAAVSTIAPPMFSSSSFLNYTAVQGARSSTVLELLPTSNSQQVTILKATISTNTTSIVASQVPHEVASGYRSWTTTPIGNSAVSTRVPSGAILPSGFVINPDKTQLDASQTASAVAWSNSTISRPVFNISRPIDTTTLKPTSLSVGVSPTVSHSISVTTTLETLKSNSETTKTVTAAFSPIRFATGSATASPPPLPPLTTSQTAGVAIAGTAGLLIAVVAAIYIARRYHAKKSRRTSTGSIYPKVAYLYDPSTGGSGGDAGSEEAFMSGGSNGLPLDEHQSRAPRNSLGHDRRYSSGILPVRFSDPGNPFRDAEDPLRYSNNSTSNSTHASPNAAATFFAGIKGYSAASQNSPRTSDFPTTPPSHDITWPLPSVMGDVRSASRSSILSEITSMAYNSNVYTDTPAVHDQSLSPYGFHHNRSLPCVRETSYTESIRDPFEHDLILQVDARTETPESVTIYAPPTASNQTTHATTPIKVLSKNPWASSMLSPNIAQDPSRPDSRHSDETIISPNATIVASERYSLAYDDQSSTTYIAPSQKQVHNTIPSGSPPPVVVHRGWDDIKRFSVEKVVPSPPSLSPPLRYMSPPPTKKRSLPQIRRKELALASSGEGMLSNARLSSMVKSPFTHNRSSGAEALRMSQSANFDTVQSRNDDNVRSSDSTFSHSVQSLALFVQKKKSGNLEFACAGIK